MSVPVRTLASAPISFASVSANIAGPAAWAFPTNVAQTAFRFPSSNTREVMILNTGANPLLVGLFTASSEAALPSATVTGLSFPYAFSNVQFPLAAGGIATIVPSEGDNCTRVPVGASLILTLGAFEQRGCFSPAITVDPTDRTLSYPLYLLFFSSVVGATTADLTYMNTFGQF